MEVREVSAADRLQLRMLGNAKVVWSVGGRPCGAPGELKRVEQIDDQGGGQPLEVDCRGRQESLNPHVLKAASDRAGEAVPGFRFAMLSLRAPAMPLVEIPVLVGPSLAPAPGT